MTSHSEGKLPQTTHLEEHVNVIAKQEQAFLANRTIGAKFADRIARFVGSFNFVFLHLVGFALWVIWNSGPFSRLPRFDPLPFPLFDTAVALEAILLASFILMRQSTLAQRADEREHLMLQVLLLTEKEVSAVVRITQQMAEHAGIAGISKDAEIRELGKRTSIDEVAQTIQDRLDQT